MPKSEQPKATAKVERTGSAEASRNAVSRKDDISGQKAGHEGSLFEKQMDACSRPREAQPWWSSRRFGRRRTEEVQRRCGTRQRSLRRHKGEDEDGKGRNKKGSGIAAARAERRRREQEQFRWDPMTTTIDGSSIELVGLYGKGPIPLPLGRKKRSSNCPALFVAFSEAAGVPAGRKVVGTLMQMGHGSDDQLRPRNPELAELLAVELER